MSDWGIRVSQPGHSVLTGTDPQMVMSSKFDNLRIHSRGTGTIYDSTGRTHTIAHNLGYVPAFIVHSQPDVIFNEISGSLAGKYFISPINPIASDIGSPYFWSGRETATWADATNIYIKVSDNYGYEYAFTDNEENNYGNENVSYFSGFCSVGKSADGSELWKGAIRFNSIGVEDSVYKAALSLYMSSAGSVTTQVKTWGIDEDDTSNFAGSPFAKSKTTASVTNSRDGGIATGNNWSYDVTDIFNEIISRGGWTTNYHMGFLLEDNGSSNDSEFTVYYLDDDSGSPFYTSKTHVKWLKNDLLTNYRYTIFKNKLV